MTDIDIDAIRQHPDRSIDDKFERLVAERDDLAGALVEAERERDEAEAKVAELTAEMERVRLGSVELISRAHYAEQQLALARAELADARNQAHRDNTEHQQTLRANTELANERDALREQVCVVVTCKECGRKYEYDGIVTHFSSLDEAHSLIEDDDWKIVGNDAICDRCLHTPHAFKSDGLDVLTCERCGLEEDDHEPAAEKTGAAR